MAGMIGVGLAVACVYWVARAVCGFSIPQSVFLAAFAGLVLAASHLRQLAARRFQPFSFWLQPNYRAILTDAGLLSRESETNEQEWALLMQANAEETAQWDAGAECFVLSYDVNADRHLVAWPAWKTYTSRLDVPCLTRVEVESLPLAKAYPARCRKANGKLRAALRITQNRTGISVVLELDDEWWAARWVDSPSVKPSLKEWIDPFSGVVQLTVATIPLAELQASYCWEPSVMKVSRGRRDRAREDFGWKEDYKPIYPTVWGFGISHRYATVTHEPIDHLP
jgi:hypothetical protein